MPIRTVAPPSISLDTPDVCPGSTDWAMADGVWSDYSWSIQNGTIVAPGPGGPRSVIFRPSGSGPVTLTVNVTDSRGCHATQSITVPIRTIAAPVVTASGPTSFCEGGSVTLTAPSGYSSYTWSNGATSQSIVVSASGSYSVSVNDFGGCSATSAPTTVAVNAIPSAVITASGPTSFCGSGSVTLTASSGASYLWSNGATSQAITVADSGSYSVTVTSAGGCTATSSPVTVSANPIPSAAITADGPTTFCTGGSVNLSAPAGAASYLWSNGTTTPSIHVSAAGTYSVTVTSAAGCSASSAQSVNVYPPPVATITPSHSTTFCESGNVILFGGGSGNYLWSTGETTPQIAVSTSGTYTLTVSNSLCSSTASIDVTVLPAPPKPVIAAGGPLTFCAGGSVTLTAPAGYTYSWSNPAGASTQSIVATTSGNYTVTILGANGCSSTSDTVVVNVLPVPSTPVVTASGPTTFCDGGSVTLTAPAAASYLWSNGATSQSITSSNTGSYSVTVTNGSGCTSATSSPIAVTVNSNPTASITASGATTFCEGGSVTLTASAASSYLWSNGATTQSIVATTSGNYSVTVTNASGCTTTSASTAVTVNANPAATITASGPTTFCAGGSVTLTASAGSSYLWSNGATTQSITVTASGNHSVTVTNASGCSATSAATAVTVNGNPTATITASGPTTFCAGGSVTLSASAGSSYLWSNGATTQSITVNATGNFSVTVTNVSGCSTTSAATAVTVNSNPVATITASGPTTFCTGGSVTLTASAGSSYLWSNGATTQSIIVNASGNFSVAVTNASGCSATSTSTTVAVNSNPVATITPSGPTTFCAGGSVTLTASAGSSYLWSNGATTQSITVNATGNFRVTVTNASGCIATSASTAVTVNSNPIATITASGPTTFCAGGSVTLTASAGSSYLWSNGAATQSITVNATGNYSVAVTNASGCSTTSVATAVTVNATPAKPVITPNGPTTFCQGGSVTLTAPAGYASYLWSNGATTQSITVSSGGFTVTVSNGSCSATSDQTFVTPWGYPDATITPFGSMPFCEGGGTITLATGQSSSLTYLWSTGETTANINVHNAGTYTVTITNQVGCSTTSQPFVVTTYAKPTAVVSGTTAICAGASADVRADLTGTSPWRVTWSDGLVQSNVTSATLIRTVAPSSSTSYTITQLQDGASNCVGDITGTAAITVNPLPATPTITAGGPTTFCAGGSVTLTASSGSSYLWSNGATTQSIVVTASGNYTVAVKNASGCNSANSAPKAVVVNAAPSITGFSPTLQSVPKNHAAQRITVTATGTSLTYQWYSGTSPSTASPISGATTNSYLPPTTVRGTFKYWVRVRNSSGCTADSGTATVTVN